MEKVLLTFGDSWPQGGELRQGQRPYGELIKEQLGFTHFINYGSAGASNEDMLYQLQRFLQSIATQSTGNTSITAIFHLTNPSRTIHWPPNTNWDMESKECQDWPESARRQMKKLFLHFNNTDQEIMRSSTTVTALQAWCKLYQIDDYYFSGWIKYNKWLPGLDLTKIWKQGLETAADWFGAKEFNSEHLLNVAKNPYITPNFAHPNQQGHQLIADNLSAWIKLKQ